MVSIDSSGQWWRGGTFDDIAEYVHEYTADGYSAEAIRISLERERDLDYERIEEGHVLGKIVLKIR